MWQHRPRPAGPLTVRWALTTLTALGALAACSTKTEAENLVMSMKAKLTLPMKVDDDTQLDDVRALGEHELGYFLTLTTMDKARADSRPVAATLEKQARSNACQNPGYKQLFAAGFHVRIVYRTQDQVELLQVLLTPKDCGGRT